MEMKIKTLADLRAADKATGGTFFSKGNMEFFSSIIHSIYPVTENSGYMVTSEKYGEDVPRHYAIRRYVATDERVRFDTQDEQYATLEAARAEARHDARNERKAWKEQAAQREAISELNN